MKSGMSGYVSEFSVHICSKWTVLESRITGGPFKGGLESSTPRSLIDIYPTLLDAAGIQPAANQTLDGVSLIGSGLITSTLHIYRFAYGVCHGMCDIRHEIL